MPVTKKITIPPPAFKDLLSAAKKLSAEEKQLLWLELYAKDAIDEMKAFEKNLKKSKPSIKMSDDEIVNITTSIRRKKYAGAKKMLH